MAKGKGHRVKKSEARGQTSEDGRQNFELPISDFEMFDGFNCLNGFNDLND